MKKIAFIIATTILTLFELRCNAQLFDPRPNEVCYRKEKRIKKDPSFHIRTDTLPSEAKAKMGNYSDFMSVDTERIQITTDSVFLYNDTLCFSSKGIWKAIISAGAVEFIVPPKQMIIGHTSYTSIFLNGNWYFMMDPTPVK